MPVAFDSGSNTSMLLDVAGSVLAARPVENLVFPATPPTAWGIAVCDEEGRLSWLEQYVSALTPDPSYSYFFSGALTGGRATLVPDRPLLLRPYSRRVVYAVHLKCRLYNEDTAAAVFAQGTISFDPTQPLESQWSSSMDEKYGDSGGLELRLNLTRVLPPGVTVAIQVTSATSVSGTVSIDAILYYPIELPR